MGSDGTHFAVLKPCSGCPSCDEGRCVPGEATESRAAFGELPMAQPSLLREAEGTTTVRQPGARASMTPA